MEAVKQQVLIPQNRELLVRLPHNALAETEAEVIVLYQIASDEADAEMAMAAKDPLFMADLLDVMEDFQHADLDQEMP